jgi:hypothetical protein
VVSTTNDGCTVSNTKTNNAVSLQSKTAFKKMDVPIRIAFCSTLAFAGKSIKKELASEKTSVLRLLGCLLLENLAQIRGIVVRIGRIRRINTIRYFATATVKRVTFGTDIDTDTTQACGRMNLVDVHTSIHRDFVGRNAEITLFRDSATTRRDVDGLITATLADSQLVEMDD